MEKKLQTNHTLLKIMKNQLVSKLLAYAVLLIGITLLVVTCHDLTKSNPYDRMLYTLSPINQFWLILIIGLLLTVLLATVIRLIQLTHQYSSMLNQVKHDFNHEIAEHREAEATQKKLEIALLEGQKLQAIGTLAGGIAHDFNNILYAINGYVDMAREDVPEDSITFKNLGKVLEASQRGQDLVARILDFGRRKQHYEQKPIEVNSILENVLALLKPTIPSSIHIDLTGTNNHYVILGNQTQLHQVIVNIINNAVDAMYGEGTITIAVSSIAANNAYLKQFPKIGNTNYCKIDITDTGHGMDQATLKRIFEPFYTTKEVGKGTGLGLATVHGIITQHHGEVTVTSQLGVGTTFTLLIPEYQALPTQTEDTNGYYSFSGR